VPNATAASAASSIPRLRSPQDAKELEQKHVRTRSRILSKRPSQLRLVALLDSDVMVPRTLSAHPTVGRLGAGGSNPATPDSDYGDPAAAAGPHHRSVRSRTIAGGGVTLHAVEPHSATEMGARTKRITPGGLEIQVTDITRTSSAPPAATASTQQPPLSARGSGAGLGVHVPLVTVNHVNDFPESEDRKRKRDLVLNEVMSTESTYVAEFRVLVDKYLSPASEQNLISKTARSTLG